MGSIARLFTLLLVRAVFEKGNTEPDTIGQRKIQNQFEKIRDPNNIHKNDQVLVETCETNFPQGNLEFALTRKLAKTFTVARPKTFCFLHGEVSNSMRAD